MSDPKNDLEISPLFPSDPTEIALRIPTAKGAIISITNLAAPTAADPENPSLANPTSDTIVDGHRIPAGETRLFRVAADGSIE